MRLIFRICLLLALSFFASSAHAEGSSAENEVKEVKKSSSHSVFVIPVKGPIAESNWYIFRRGLKEAIERNADVVLLDMDTPGGALNVTFDMIDALQRFQGETMTFVNQDAISAGAYISSATKDIYFAPNGKIGAAAVVDASGGDIGETMKQKIDSYLKAKVRTFAKNYPYGTDVIRAMMDSEFELKIDGEILLDKHGNPMKAKGELLTLTADEAMQLVGKEQTPLFGSGIYNNVDELLDARFGKGNYTITKVEPSGFEVMAQTFEPFASIFLGIGILLIFFELKSPGFGIPGIAGVCLIALYFIMQHVAGLSGYEGIILFALGVVLVAIEIFLFPGMIIFALLGVILIFAGILWGSADIWKLPDGSFDFDWSVFFYPLQQLVIAISTLFIVGVLAYKFLPSSWIKNKIVLQTTVGDMDEDLAKGARSRDAKLPDVGSSGVALTEFRPSGIIQINGKRYEASSGNEAVAKGDEVEVVGYGDFDLIVRKK